MGILEKSRQLQELRLLRSIAIQSCEVPDSVISSVSIKRGTLCRMRRNTLGCRYSVGCVNGASWAIGPGWTTGPAATASAVGCKATSGSRIWKLLSWLTLDSSRPKVTQGLRCTLSFAAAVRQVPQQWVRASAEQQVSYSKWPKSSGSLVLGGHICHIYNTYPQTLEQQACTRLASCQYQITLSWE